MDEKARERFWEKVEKTDGCWIWTSSITPRGYGQFSLNNYPHYAHRLSLEMKLGRPIGEGLQAAHEPLVCHTRACVNPDHLREATNAENAADRYTDGTTRQRQMTDDQIRAIRADQRVQRVIAEEYGISRSFVAAIKARRHYAHVADVLTLTD